MTLCSEAKSGEKMLSPSQRILMTYCAFSPMLNPQHIDIMPFLFFQVCEEPRQTLAKYSATQNTNEKLSFTLKSKYCIMILDSYRPEFKTVF